MVSTSEYAECVEGTTCCRIALQVLGGILLIVGLPSCKGFAPSQYEILSDVGELDLEPIERSLSTLEGDEELCRPVPDNDSPPEKKRLLLAAKFLRTYHDALSTTASRRCFNRNWERARRALVRSAQGYEQALLCRTDQGVMRFPGESEPIRKLVRLAAAPAAKSKRDNVASRLLLYGLPTLEQAVMDINYELSRFGREPEVRRALQRLLDAHHSLHANTRGRRYLNQEYQVAMRKKVMMVELSLDDLSLGSYSHGRSICENGFDE